MMKETEYSETGEPEAAPGERGCHSYKVKPSTLAEL